MSPKFRWILPLVVLALGLVTAMTLIRSRKPADVRTPESVAPLVRVMNISAEPHTFVIESEGTVVPRTEITLSAEVGGRVISAAPALSAGGFFAQGDVLATVDPLDYEAVVERAVVAVRQAERRVAEEEAFSEIARTEWDRAGEGEPTPLTLREPQLAEAKAQLASAEKSLAIARRDLARTQIRAPFTGRVRTKFVDVGQSLSPGMPVALVYAVDFAEVRLAVSSADLAFVDLPLGYGSSDQRTPVTLSAMVAGQEWSWPGLIDRTEGAVDPRTRLFYAVARIEDPYALDHTTEAPPLAAGLFVRARIEGRTVDSVWRVPRRALRGADKLVVVDADDRLQLRLTEILRMEGEFAVLASGPQPGDRVCLSTLDSVVEGTAVRVELAAPVEGSSP